jgi:[ribosomal protein S5]-alanine N-acetyltransferase
MMERINRNWPDQFPVLTTDRFTLRALTEHDLPELVIRCNYYDISKQTSSLPFPYTLNFAVGRLKLIQDGFNDKSRLVWVIIETVSDKVVGEMGLHWREETDSMEVGYWIGLDFWGMGIATECLKRVLDFTNEIKIAKYIYGTHFADNPASGRTMEKAGMTSEGYVDPVLNQAGELKELKRFRFELE